MRYLLDTCTVSDFVRGEAHTLDRVKHTPPDEIAVSTITEMEIAYGLRLNPALSRRIKPMMDIFLATISILPYDRAAASACAELRAILKRQGRPIGAYDALIASTALAHELILVTSNRREFERVAGLRTEDWR